MKNFLIMSVVLSAALFAFSGVSSAQSKAFVDDEVTAQEIEKAKREFARIEKENYTLKDLMRLYADGDPDDRALQALLKDAIYVRMVEESIHDRVVVVNYGESEDASENTGDNGQNEAQVSDSKGWEVIVVYTPHGKEHIVLKDGKPYNLYVVKSPKVESPYYCEGSVCSSPME